MKHFSKTQTEEKTKNQDAVHTAHEKLNEAVENFNAAMAEEWKKVESAQEAYIDAVTQASGWLDEVRSEAQSYFDERSEKWQESDAGQQYQAWLDALGTEFDEPVGPEQPAELEMPEDVSDAIGEVPESADEA